ncbi:superoxide dismutase family protein [Yunchengibacter salinarum]|uniref:superoxide dismutase family protein n=1 Tax=Yunchengibacter salinarum TaxID=3133399 RepID=UPI0035B624DF
MTLHRRQWQRKTGMAALGALAVSALSLGLAPEGATAHDQHTANAMMHDQDGREIGKVVLTETDQGVHIKASLTNIPAGAHGFHLHETGSCEDGFKAAGGHYNPEGNSHGFYHGDGRHAGDLPNIHAEGDEIANAEMFTDLVSLNPDADNSLMDSDGSAVIVHQYPDSYGEQAGAGGRIACGVVTRIKHEH